MSATFQFAFHIFAYTGWFFMEHDKVIINYKKEYCLESVFYWLNEHYMVICVRI